MMAKSGCKSRQRFVFMAQIVYLGEPGAVARYSALEPAYCFELIEMLPTRQVQVGILLLTFVLLTLFIAWI